jgi:hypothetical protein
LGYTTGDTGIFIFLIQGINMNRAFSFVMLLMATSISSMQHLIVQQIHTRKYCQHSANSLASQAIRQQLQRKLEKNWDSFKKNCKEADAWKVTMGVCADFGCNNSCIVHGAICCREIYEMHESAAKKNALALHALKKQIDQLDACMAVKSKVNI